MYKDLLHLNEIPDQRKSFEFNMPQYISGNYAIQNCDLLLSIGSRLDTRQTGGQLESFSRDSYKIMVELQTVERKMQQMKQSLFFHHRVPTF